MSRQTDMAYQYIKEKILSGIFKPSQKLTEVQLTEMIGVSRNTIKKALLKLEQENLIVVEDNKGATIKAFTLEEIVNYLEIREVLEGLIARSAACNISNNDLDKMKDVLEQMKGFLINNEFDKYSAKNKEFHGIMYNSAPNKQAVEIINMIRTQLIRYQFRTILLPGRIEMSLKEHFDIYEALRQHDEKKAEEVVKIHISSVREVIERNYYYLS
ncbi:transcription regulator hth gntr [Lucifera butyrica]|uniref:Transcription regulator hth gntr n=1 Tax=Lucifera butyrica TaxID=1351585 RepID=A0A498RFE4_9FIRM|nr:GntR family transcriptional regulator [Lucifera butyrica]VBB09530.1 transcription regulator hth gntr [Lucifera butyrica]